MLLNIIICSVALHMVAPVGWMGWNNKFQRTMVSGMLPFFFGPDHKEISSKKNLL